MRSGPREQSSTRVKVFKELHLKCIVFSHNWAFHPIFHFSFLVDEVTKNKNRLCDFLYNAFCLQGKTGKTKMKNNEKTNKLIGNIFVFRDFCQPTWKMKNGMKSSIMKSSVLSVLFTFYITVSTFWSICLFMEAADAKSAVVGLPTAS